MEHILKNNWSGQERNVLPTLQKNANLTEAQVMRVGVPQKSGPLAFHAFNEDYPVMVSANAFWNKTTQEFNMPKFTDVTELDFALDSAGFTAMKMWQSRGTQSGMAGIFPWGFEQYVDFASESGARWFSQPDLCCEPEIAINQDEIDYRLNATATLLEGVLRVVYARQNEMAKSTNSITVANSYKPPVPVLQGWKVSDYLRSLEMMLKVWERWQPWIAPPSLIGIGSVCRRDLNDPEHGLYAILSALEREFPQGAKAHLFGVKGICVSKVKMMPWVHSYDSMAFDFSARVKAHKNGFSNSYEHRKKEMSNWMESALARMQPARGDQFRLVY